MRFSNYFRRFFTRSKRPETSANQTVTAHANDATWIAASNNPFGVRVLDCRAFIANVTTWTANPEVAKQFTQARYRDGREYLDQRPKNAVQLPANLSFPYNGAHEDGPIFMAQVMEEKWDIFLIGNRLYVTRSWTGKLVMVATCNFFADRVEVSNIEVDDEYVAGQSNYPAQLLDFLIKSHMSRWLVAHPMPQSWIGNSTEELAKLSFASFGRFGLFGTFENTIGVPKALIDSF